MVTTRSRAGGECDVAFKNNNNEKTSSGAGGEASSSPKSKSIMGVAILALNPGPLQERLQNQTRF